LRRSSPEAAAVLVAPVVLAALAVKADLIKVVPDKVDLDRAGQKASVDPEVLVVLEALVVSAALVDREDRAIGKPRSRRSRKF